MKAEIHKFESLLETFVVYLIITYFQIDWSTFWQDRVGQIIIPFQMLN